MLVLLGLAAVTGIIQNRTFWVYGHLINEYDTHRHGHPLEGVYLMDLLVVPQLLVALSLANAASVFLASRRTTGWVRVSLGVLGAGVFVGTVVWGMLALALSRHLRWWDTP